jgi:phytoene synthase
VGKMLLPMLAPDAKKDLTAFAVALGRAFQLTNILRDVGEDYRRNRIYLPNTLMKKHGYSIADLNKQIINPSFIALWEEIASVAEKNYQEALQWIEFFPPDIRFSLQASLFLYREILTVIRREDYQVMNQKLFVTQEEKIKLIETLKSK